MEYIMGLYETPFNSIKTGRKKVEVRLNDEKRRQLKIGDSIKFLRVPGERASLTVKVTGLSQYPMFKEMYEDIPASDLDAIGDSIDEMVEQTYKIYTPEKEKKWGTVAIKIKLLD